MPPDRHVLRFTDHAVRQYRRRYQPELSFDECARVLVAAASSARPNPDRRCYRNATVWRIGALGDVDAVVVQGYDGPRAVTIYWPRQVNGREIDPAELAEAEERLLRAEQAQAEAARALEAVPPPPPPPPPPPRGSGDMFEAWHVAKERHKTARLELTTAELVTSVIKDEMKTLRHAISRDAEDMKRALRLALDAMAPELRATVRAEISKFNENLATDKWLLW